MPTMDGYEFVRRLRADPAIAATEVVFYSAHYREREARNLAQSCGVTRVLCKPCEPAELLQVIDEALAHQVRQAPPAIGAEFDHEHLRLVMDQLSAKADELEHSNRRLAALTDLNLRLASEKDPRALLDSVCRGARDLVGARISLLLVREKNGGGESHFSISGISADLAAHLGAPALGEGWLGQVHTQSRPARLAGIDGVAGGTKVAGGTGIAGGNGVADGNGAAGAIPISGVSQAAGADEVAGTGAPAGGRGLGLPAGFPRVASLVAAPIVSLKNLYGWICLCDKVGYSEFSEDDERLLAILGAQFGRIYENGSLYHELNQRADQLQTEIAERERTSRAMVAMLQRLEALRKLDAAILAARSPVEIAQTALQFLGTLVPYWSASVVLLDSQGTNPVFLAASRGDAAHTHQPLDRLTLEQFGRHDFDLLRQGGTREVPDVDALPERSGLVETLRGEGLRSYIRLPMMVEGSLVGALSLGSDTPGYFTPDRVEFARAISNQLGIAVQQALLRERIAHQAAELEQRVAERTAQLAAANDDLKSFSYTVSHDLRAPLRAINGFSHMFEEEFGARMDERALALFGRIRQSAGRMESLIEDLLKFAQVGMAHVSMGQVDMARLAEEAWHEVAAPAGVVFRIGALPAAQCDRGLLKQVWANLLSNACKYSSKQAQPVVEVSATETGGELVYRISDNGAGFDMRYYEKLFGVFQRLHTEREFPGTGVGLATVHRIITRHAGRVWAESEPDHGARFYFSLPAPAVPQNAAPQSV
jgi:signal transduction histidine kinase